MAHIPHILAYCSRKLRVLSVNPYGDKPYRLNNHRTETIDKPPILRTKCKESTHKGLRFHYDWDTLLELPRLFRQHDRNAVADRIGEFGGA